MKQLQVGQGDIRELVQGHSFWTVAWGLDLGVWLCLLYMLSADQLSRHRKPGEKCCHLPPINFLCCPNSSSLASSLDPILILREVLVGLGWKGCPPTGPVSLSLCGAGYPFIRAAATEGSREGSGLDAQIWCPRPCAWSARPSFQQPPWIHPSSTL